tara:strand:+ start:47 stop:481 length:435 start_codon:yes stop_codon:yes gene_type:complete
VLAIKLTQNLIYGGLIMIEVYQAEEFGNNEKPYCKVAEFDHDSLQEAYQDTQNLDELWCNKLIGFSKSYAYRSTSSGDVIVVNGKAHFLVPMGNGRYGNKMYQNWGETEVINNFDASGFIYNGDHKIFAKDGGLLGTFTTSMKK